MARVSSLREQGQSPQFLLLLALSAFASAFSLRIVDPALTLIAADFGLSLSVAAWLSSAYALPYAFMQLLLGPLGDATGRRPIVIVSLGIMSAGLLLSAISPNFPILVATRVLVGGFAGAIIPAAMALVGDRVPLANRPLALSRILAASLLGQVTGAALSGGLSEVVGWRAVFGLSAAIASVAGFAAMRLPHDRPQVIELSIARANAGYRMVFANRRSIVVLFTVAAEGFCVFAVFPFVAPMLAELGVGSTKAGITLAMFGIGGICYGVVAGVLHIWFTKRMLTGGGAMLAGTSYVAVSGFTESWPMLAVLFLLCGFGFYMLHNTMQFHATEMAPTVRGSALALFASAFFLGQALGPLAAGLMIEATSYKSVFLASGLALAILGLASNAMMRRIDGT